MQISFFLQLIFHKSFSKDEVVCCKSQFSMEISQHLIFANIFELVSTRSKEFPAKRNLIYHVILAPPPFWRMMKSDTDYSPYTIAYLFEYCQSTRQFLVQTLLKYLFLRRGSTFFPPIFSPFHSAKFVHSFFSLKPLKHFSHPYWKLPSLLGAARSIRQDGQ